MCEAHLAQIRRHGRIISNTPLRNVNPPDICTIDGCGKPHKAKGLCIAHYDKLLVYGNPMVDLRQQKRICQIDGCDKKHLARGLCANHLSKLRKYGDPKHGVERGSGPKYYTEVVLKFDGDECFTEWPFFRLKNGYARTLLPNRKTRLVHRLVCEDTHGPAPSAKHHAAHECGNPRCNNKRHLSWKTPTENNADKIVHDTHRRGARHYGVLLTEASVKQIRKMYGSKSARVVGKMFGVSRGAVESIWRKKSWAWLKD